MTSTLLLRITFLPVSRTWSIAAVFSSAQLADVPMTGTVVDLPLSKFVIFNCVPTGHLLLVTPGAAASAKSVGFPAHADAPPPAAGGAAGGWAAAPPLTTSTLLLRMTFLPS